MHPLFQHMIDRSKLHAFDIYIDCGEDGTKQFSLMCHGMANGEECWALGDGHETYILLENAENVEEVGEDGSLIMFEESGLRYKLEVRVPAQPYRMFFTIIKE